MTRTPRTCGRCTACCTALRVPDVPIQTFASWQGDVATKEAGTPCHQLQASAALVQSVGCGIYPHRPEACSTWSCAWLKGLIPYENDRPDLRGMIVNGPLAPITLEGVTLEEHFAVHELWQDAFTSEANRALLGGLTSTSPVLFFYWDGRLAVMGPDIPTRVWEPEQTRKHLPVMQ